MNFDIAPTEVPTLEVMSSIEAVIHYKNSPEMEVFRWKIRTEMAKTNKMQPKETQLQNDRNLEHR